MDFLDPAKRRAHSIRLFIGYGVMTILIGLVAIIMLFYAYGYNFDPLKGTVTQDGLVFLNSRPSGAEIIVNDSKIKNRTDTRLSLLAGEYDIELSFDGYRPWKRSLTLEGGIIERMQYPLLIPSQLSESEIELLPALASMVSQSTDRRWLLIAYSNQLQFLQRYDLNQADPLPEQINLPAGLLSNFSGARQLKVIDWASDNNRVLIEHSGDSAKEFIMLDLNTPAASFNINALFNLSPVEVTMRNRLHDQFYIFLSDGRLLGANAATRVTGLAAERVQAYRDHGDNIFVYVQSPLEVSSNPKIIINEAGRNYTLRETAANSSYLLDVSRFNNNWYFAVGAASQGKVYIYKNPQISLKKQTSLPAVPSAFLRIDNPKELSFSPNGRFIALQSDNKFAVYDAEMNRQHKFDINEPFDGQIPAEWMDGHHFKAVIGGTAVIFDFDGINIEKLVKADPGAGFYFDDNYENLFAVRASGSSPTQGSIYRTPLLNP